MVPKHSLHKYFTLTFTRHKSSKFDCSGPPLKPVLPLNRAKSGKIEAWALSEFGYVGAISEELVEFDDDCLCPGP